MNIVDFLNKGSVSSALQAKTKEEVLEEMVELLVVSGEIKKPEKKEILKRLQEREALGSTGIGKGVAIPHAKCPNVKKMISAFGISAEGVDFKSLDGDPTYIFFLLIAPGETPGPHLKALAKISRLLDDRFVRERLRGAKSPQEIYKIIKEEEQKKI
ncbi:MAG: PTS sugar transporter subunit IIA [Candidatus Omnitrophica bacterium]|nr:PTS sugar transporter subunit IIA [Candidatus Omnitrophota bacterium]MDD5487559.1 PTS sugar transporter subunit IIA [Candidatus Omnitrophota bacterium]